MTHAHIERLKLDTLAMSALLKTQAGEPLNADEKKLVTELRKNAALENRLREKYDLSGAITKALRNPSVGGATVVSEESHGKGNLTIGARTLPIYPSAVESSLRKSKDADESEQARILKERRAKIRRDITGGN